MTSLARVLALSAVAAALVFTAPASAETVIKIGLALPKGMAGFDHVNGMYETFGREVEVASKGELKVDLAYGGSLGNPNDRMNQMRRGIIQMSDASDGNYATIYPDVQVFSLPYLFPDEKTAWKVFDGPLGTAMAEDLRRRPASACSAGGRRAASAISAPTSRSRR